MFGRSSAKHHGYPDFAHHGISIKLDFENTMKNQDRERKERFFSTTAEEGVSKGKLYRSQDSLGQPLQKISYL